MASPAQIVLDAQKLLTDLQVVYGSAYQPTSMTLRSAPLDIFSGNTTSVVNVPALAQAQFPNVNLNAYNGEINLVLVASAKSVGGGGAPCYIPVSFADPQRSMFPVGYGSNQVKLNISYDYTLTKNVGRQFVPYVMLQYSNPDNSIAQVQILGQSATVPSNYGGLTATYDIGLCRYKQGLAPNGQLVLMCNCLNNAFSSSATFNPPFQADLSPQACCPPLALNYNAPPNKK